jgi:hypothetical protein
MTRVLVHRPTPAAPTDPVTPLAARGRQPDRARLLIVDNGKPRGRQLMERIADRIAERLRIAEIEVMTKASAGKPLDADETRMLAVRSHLVISGLGD